MTNEEAFLILLETIMPVDKENEALEKALEALRKQIPEKPIHITRNEHSTRIIGYGCPACHKDVIGSGFYCWSCGQAIDWSDEI